MYLYETANIVACPCAFRYGYWIRSGEERETKGSHRDRFYYRCEMLSYRHGGRYGRGSQTMYDRLYKGGLPVGILEAKTEKLYVVVPAKGMKGANEEMLKYADHKVKLTGMFMEKSGQKMFFYSKVEEAK